MPPLMSAFIMRLLRGEPPIIYGDGEKRRDFIYIDDVTSFNALALVDARTDGRVYNVGTGVNYSLNEIYAQVAALVGVAIPPLYKPELPGEADVTLADVTDSLALGWRPRVSLTEGLERSIEYITHVLDASGQTLR
jgi:UDP-glucose 4-epimerase